MNFNLIVPAAADTPVSLQEMPRVFRLGPDGIMMCVKAITGLNLAQFSNIYFTILRKHEELYCLSGLFQLQFRRLGINHARVVVLDEPTTSQPATVYQTIVREHLTGCVFIKDADVYFSCDDVTPQNCIAIYPLESVQWVNPQNKSYVSVDDNYYVTNIIEKKIVSHYFCSGGYGFADVQDFIHYYDELKREFGLYLSHIIYAMLLDKHIFRPIKAKDYFDYEQFE